MTYAEFLQLASNRNNVTSPELTTIRDMLIPLPESGEEISQATKFTCRHYDPKGNRCLIHHDRPNMCKAFPYEEECQHCGYREFAYFPWPHKQSIRGMLE
jgi:Fe-S-cluster containining protein